jgi:hypothetical protein
MATCCVLGGGRFAVYADETMLVPPNTSLLVKKKPIPRHGPPGLIARIATNMILTATTGNRWGPPSSRHVTDTILPQACTLGCKVSSFSL